MLTYLIVFAVFYLIGWVFTDHPWLTVLGLWSAGALATAAVVLLQSKSASTQDGDNQAEESPSNQRLRDRLLGHTFRLCLLFFGWPAFCLGELEVYWPRLAVRLGLRPEWSLVSSAELQRQTWRLRCGQEFSASLIAGSRSEDTVITAELDNGTVEFRLTKLAPLKEGPGRWHQMRRLSKDEWSYQTEDEMSQDELPPYQISQHLERGRYAIDFRIEADGISEEFGSLIAAVY